MTQMATGAVPMYGSKQTRKSHTMKHLDDLRLFTQFLRKKLLEETYNKDLMVSKPDREAVIDAVLPYLIKVMN